MPVVRYRSPDDPAFVVFDKARFRVEPAELRPSGPSRSAEALESPPRLAGRLESRPVLKLVEEDRRIRACLEWLGTLGGDDDDLVTPELVHEATPSTSSPTP